MIQSYSDNERRLGDIVQYGNSEEIEKALQEIRKNFLETTKWIRVNIERSQKNLVLHNFLFSSIPYIDIAASNYSGLVQILAFCARNLYEIHLQSRYVQRDEKSLQQWVAEAATDHIDILEGFLGLDPSNLVGQNDILQSEISHKKDLLKKHNLEQKRPYPISKVAADLSKKDEHKSLYKVFSKLLHPTSYLVNSSPEEIQNPEMRNLLIIHIQLYAWDIVGSIRNTVGFPAS